MTEHLRQDPVGSGLYEIPGYVLVEDLDNPGLYFMPTGFIEYEPGLWGAPAPVLPLPHVPVVPPTIIGVPRAVPVIELGVGASATPTGVGRWQVSRWGQPSATWVGNEPFWWGITCEVHNVETYVGHERAADTWDVGTAIVVLRNLTGWADYPPSAPDQPTLLSVRPGRPIRIGVSIDAGPTSWLWRGYVDAADPGYEPEMGSIVTLSCIDAKGEAGRANAAGLATPVGAGETVTTRIGRVLDATNWPAYRRDLAASSVTLLPTSLGGTVTDLVDLAADSAGGAVFGDINGRVAYRARSWQTYAPGAPFDATVGNVDATDVCPSSWDVSFAREDITTQVQIGRHSDAAPLVFNDVEGQTLYGVEPYDRTDLETQSVLVLNSLGQRHLATRGHLTAPRISAVTLDAATGDDVVDLLAACDPRTPTRLHCRHDESGRVVFDRNLFVVGIRHSIGPDGWEARVALDDADASDYIAAPNPRWGSARWQRALWAA